MVYPCIQRVLLEGGQVGRLSKTMYIDLTGRKCGNGLIDRCAIYIVADCDIVQGDIAVIFYTHLYRFAHTKPAEIGQVGAYKSQYAYIVLCIRDGDIIEGKTII